MTALQSSFFAILPPPQQPWSPRQGRFVDNSFSSENTLSLSGSEVSHYSNPVPDPKPKFKPRFCNVLWRIILAHSYIKCCYLFSNKKLQQGEMKIKPSILEDILVGFNALIRNKLEMMVKAILGYSFSTTNAKSLSLHWKQGDHQGEQSFSR